MPGGRKYTVLSGSMSTVPRDSTITEQSCSVLHADTGPCHAPGLRLRELQTACPRGFLRAALRRALCLHYRTLVTRARLQS